MTAPAKNIRVDARLFAACALVQSTEETRPYLQGTYVCPHPVKGALIVATDGHRMMVAHDPEGECQSAAICAVPKGAFTLKFKEPAVIPAIEIDGEGIAALGTFRSEKSVYVDGSYPDWAAVVHPILLLAKKQSFSPASFNGDYLGSFGKVAKIIAGRQNSVSLRLISFTSSEPALILFPDEHYAFGVLMPMRADVPGNALPLFMKEVLEPSRKSKPEAA